MPLLIFIHASPILIHALPILIHWLGFRLSAPYPNTCITYLNTLTRLHILLHWTDTTRQPIRIEIPRLSAANQNRDPSALGSQSESSITSPESSANQNRVLRHPRAFGYGGGRFSALGSSRLAIAYLDTWRPPTPPPPTTWSAHTLTTDV